MLVDAPLILLGGMSPAQFMRRHWQKRPLLVRQAWPGLQPPLDRAALFELAARRDVESRLVRRQGAKWTVRQGPLPRRALPALKHKDWTLLVQGMDLHVPAARQILDRFDFIPHARLDDLMVSWASDDGGVGPHLDSYDVFLLQVQGQRRWRIGRSDDSSLVDGLPLKILRHFEPEQEWLLEAGDMLYLPPRWAHDGSAVGECMTASVGFRAPGRDELAQSLMARWLDRDLPDGTADDPLYKDPRQVATAQAGRIPAPLAEFAQAAVQRAMNQRGAIEQALGEWLSEPKPQVCFESGATLSSGCGLQLDPRSRMLYDEHCLYLNGESWRMSGTDARVLRRLADRRHVDATTAAGLSTDARAIVREWVDAGWLHGEPHDR